MEMTQKQTAVEWLVKKLNQKIDYIPMHKWNEIADIVSQSKAIEKEQIIEAFQEGQWSVITSEEYYKETFRGVDD